MLTCRAIENGFRWRAGIQAIAASLRCCRFSAVSAVISDGFPDGFSGCPVLAVSRPPALLLVASAFGHGRCRFRVACTSPKDAGFSARIAARQLASACFISFRLRADSHPCCTNLIDHLSLHRDGLPRRRCGDIAVTVRAVASFAVRFKGCSPQRARGRERLSHR